MGNKTCQCTKGAFEHLRKLGPKSFSKTYMKVELKETSYCWKLGKERMHKTNEKELV